MKGKICAILVLFLMLTGCTQAVETDLEKDDTNQEQGVNDTKEEQNEILPLDYTVAMSTREYLHPNASSIFGVYTEDLVEEVLKVKEIDDGRLVKLLKNKTNDLISGAIQVGDTIHLIPELSRRDISEESYGIEEVEVFGKKAIKFYGELRGYRSLNYYWFYDQEEEEEEDAILQVAGKAIEIDLNGNGKKEVVASIDLTDITIIYVYREDVVMSARINSSINAKSVKLLDEDSKIFEVYFETGYKGYYLFENDSFTRVE